MRLSIWLAGAAALVVLGLVLVAGQALLRPDLPLITDAAFSLETISPNADGSDDVTVFSYSLSRNARVSLVFEDASGQVFTFRTDEIRAGGDYQVEFSGVVDGYLLPGETIQGEVQRRLLRDGIYTWRLTALPAGGGEAVERSGALTVTDASSTLPELVTFDVSPEIFTPNQDGIWDRARINVYLLKAARLTAYLENEDGLRVFLQERQEGRKPGEPGRHDFDYDGGVDLGADPPPDGLYRVVAVAEDAEGQRVLRTGSMTIRDGGDPQAEIVPQSVGVDVVFIHAPYDARYFGQNAELVAPPDDPQDLNFLAVNIPLGDLLVFKLTVENYGDVPIRTSGPPPGTVYEQSEVAASLGWYDQSGAWRVGIDCDTATRDYPWRWAVGAPDDLLAVLDEETGNTYYYLPPGQQAVVWGAVRMTDLVEARNPQKCWAGLIHEDVEVSDRNSRVGARDVELIDPSASASGES
ncbi:MAG: hypothetical protein HXY41_14715 [Chloroflexi bacterium]|nr:hypothetical protein [Chloroflexota bacterium]